jgi:hypothetical protein
VLPDRVLVPALRGNVDELPRPLGETVGESHRVTLDDRGHDLARDVLVSIILAA